MNLDKDKLYINKGISPTKINMNLDKGNWLTKITRLQRFINVDKVHYEQIYGPSKKKNMINDQDKISIWI